MSADGRRQCPRCKDRARTAAEEAAARVAEMYGRVPVDEYEQARAALLTPEAAVAAVREAFREDYEFYGADEGTVTADYGGECQDCGLKARLKQSVTFYPEAGTK